MGKHRVRMGTKKFQGVTFVNATYTAAYYESLILSLRAGRQTSLRWLSFLFELDTLTSI